MPLLKQETDLYPRDLFESELLDSETWWVMYTLSRQEKKLMRQLERLEIPFYGPTIARRYRAANGRLRTSFEPLFANYVFVCGGEKSRYGAVCTGSVSRWLPVHSPQEFIRDLRQIRDLIATEAPLAPEQRIEAGNRVRVKSGPFKGFEGIVIRRENQVRLLVSVRYMGQGASVALDDCQLDAI
ncbi:MAG: KOW motif-containing protein [Pirellulaceae bacterium]|nr:KOW motif-containing protein [Pirellulaceae bacterium]